MSSSHSGSEAKRQPLWEVQDSDERWNLLIQKMNKVKHIEDDKKRVVELLRKGEHRREVLARHLPRDMSDEALSRHKRETLEQINSKGRKIAVAMKELAGHRKDLQGVRESLAGIVESNTKARREDEKRQLEKAANKEKWGNMIGSVFQKNQAFNSATPTPDELIKYFSEEHLSDDEKMTRRVAREHGIPIPDAEVIKNMFDMFDEDKSGEIEKDEFKEILRILLGVKEKHDFPERRLDEFWRSANTDQMGGVDFPEFLVWYFQNFGAPRAFNVCGAAARAKTLNKIDGSSLTSKSRAAAVAGPSVEERMSIVIANDRAKRPTLAERMATG